MAPPREDWNRRVHSETVLASFGQWHFPWLNLPALIKRTAEIFEFPLVDRDPVERWSFGRGTPIGDAAHPMQPIGSQPGSQAIIDARALTAALLSSKDPERGPGAPHPPGANSGDERHGPSQDPDAA